MLFKMASIEPLRQCRPYPKLTHICTILIADFIGIFNLNLIVFSQNLTGITQFYPTAGLCLFKTCLKPVQNFEQAAPHLFKTFDRFPKLGNGISDFSTALYRPSKVMHRHLFKTISHISQALTFSWVMFGPELGFGRGCCDIYPTLQSIFQSFEQFEQALLLQLFNI